ncbi:aldo/keto reductase [Dactylosporangium vinaceum]|uniref:Aldo/keto reductase n=1 Tax=Dactylosporangium vinaceum TaxID=53362 RepID=A0ABV5ME27_9ACTN|nr:aldo/keto reductase [Dactylosporangium vinaceum]UAB92533.1 aldo/keto reductase [Dactylosporangium vinaceum]
MNTVRKLADGTEIPLIGLGVWQVGDGRECEDAVRWALEAGYRHIDTAQVYGNEDSVGRAIKDSGVPREDIYITTKFNPSRRDPAAELEGSLKRLGVDAVDLYLVHWPAGGPTRAWAGMQQSLERGLARSIGVSNFNVDEIAAVLALGGPAPVVNQIQFSPFEYRRTLQDVSERHNIAVEAYSPLGTGRHLGDRALAAIAERVGRTPAQVLIRWSLQRGLIVLPKSVHQERIVQNLDVFGFELSDADLAALDALDRTGGTGIAHEHPWW